MALNPAYQIMQGLPQSMNIGPYFMGWNAIAFELKKILDEVPGINKVHTYIKFMRQNSDDLDWKEEFAQKSRIKEQDEWIVNVAMLNRGEFPVIEISKDDTIMFTRTSVVEIYLFLSAYYFEDWSLLLDNVMEAITRSPRNLNETCLTREMPQGGQSLIAEFAGVDCHHSIIKFRVEEAGSLV